MVRLIKVNLGTFTKTEDIELIENLDKYIKLFNENKEPSEKLNRLKFFRNAIKKELEGKVLDNDFIDLPKPYYFNMNELKEEGIVKATAIKPIKELEETYILFNVPNNLDSFNAEANSYCYEDNFHLHRGYYVANEFDVKLDLVFSYNTSSEELEIAISNDRDIYFSLEQEEEKEKLVTEKEIYLPELDSYIIVDFVGLNVMKYPNYKYFVLKREKREEEDLIAIEEYERQQEEYFQKKYNS